MTHAIRFDRYGGPEVLRLDDVPTPEPGPGKVRIEVRAAGVNGIDWKIRRGTFARGESPDKPHGTGIEGAGVIDAVGAEVGGLRPGQPVFGQFSGAVATYALAAPRKLMVKPDWLTFEQAAALPVAVETAHRTLRHLGVSSGQTLLVHAVAGGVGLVAAQLARAWNARVIGTASPRHHAFLRDLDVHPVAYGDGVGERLRAAAPDGVDAVLDASGRDVLAVSVELAGSADHVVTIADGRRAADYGVHFSDGSDAVLSLPEVFAEVLPLLERGEVRLPIERTFPLADTVDAHRLSEAGHLRGKLVITVS